MESDVIKVLRRYRRRWFLVAGVVIGGTAVGAAAVALFLYRRSQRLRYEGTAYERGPLSGYPQVPEAEDDVRAEALRRRIEETRERLRLQMAAGGALTEAEAGDQVPAEAEGADEAFAGPVIPEGEETAMREDQAAVEEESATGRPVPDAAEQTPAAAGQTPEATSSAVAADEGAAPG